MKKLQERIQKNRQVSYAIILICLITVTMASLAACVNGNKQDSTVETETTVSSKEVVMKSDYEVLSEVIEIADGEDTVYGTLYYPDTDAATPLIIMCHGYNGSGDDFKNEAMTYAKNGIAAYTLDFCGGSTRSRSSGETTDMTIFTEKSNLLAAFTYFKDQESIDSNNIFLFGGSQGGLVTALATDELGDQVAGMALYYPALCIPDNWRDTYPELTDIPESNDFWGMTLGYEFFASIHDYEVFDHIGAFSNGVLIIHGDSDAIVPLSYSEKAVELYADAELIVMEGEGHGFSATGATTAMNDVLDFLKENIR